MKIDKTKILLSVGAVAVIAVLIYMFGGGQPEQTEKTPVAPIEQDVSRLDEKAQIELNKQSQSSLLKLATPKDGEALCQSRPYQIKWTAPKDMESLNLFLVVPGIEVKLATTPAAAGIYTWYVELSELPIPVGSGYKLKIGGSYQGNYITQTMPGTFSVKDCGTDGIDKRG